jgi:hypothetical protein
MLSHTRDGIFNNIKVYVGSRNPITNKPKTLLNGFDINACQAGLDFKNKRITYTSDFVDFLHGRQLRITIPINPIQTIIRLKKKMEDLECYCNLDYEISILKHSCLVNNVSKSFGEETYEKYVKDETFLSSHFIITPYKDMVFSIDPIDDDGEMKQLNGKPTGKQLYRFEPIIEEYTPPYAFHYPIEVLNYFRLMDGSTGGSKIRKFNRVMDYIHSFGVEEGSRGYAGYEHKGHFKGHLRSHNLHIPHSFKSKGIKKLRKQKILSVSHPMWGFLSSIPGYCDCDFDVKHVEFITNFTKEHRGLSGVIYKSDELTIQSHYKLLKAFKSVANKRGDWIIGELENMRGTLRDEFNDSENKVEWLNNYLDEAEEKLSRKLTDPLDLSNFDHKDCVIEITNNLDLLSEGRRMGHCVGGYGSRIEDGSSRIFHIECDGIGSTLEVKVGGPVWPKFGSAEKREFAEEWLQHIPAEKRYELIRLDNTLERMQFLAGQHYGRYPEKGNLTPTDNNIDISRGLIKYLNENHLEEKLKEVLYERYLLEESIRKEAYDAMIEKEKAEGKTHITTTEHHLHRGDRFNVAQQRNVPIEDIW